MGNKGPMSIQELLLESKSASQFLRNYFSHRCKENSRFSVRQWSQRLGYANPSYVSEVLNSRRKANADLVARFAKAQGLRPWEGIYLENLLVTEISKSKVLVTEKIRENESIRNYWQAGDWQTDAGDHPVDLVLQSLLLKFPDGLSLKAIVCALQPLFKEDLILSRLDRGLVLGFFVRTGERFKSTVPSGKRRMAPGAFADFLSTLVAAQPLPREKHVQGVVACTLSQQGFSKAREILVTAFEEIILLSIAEEQEGISKDENSLNTLYFSLCETAPLKGLAEV